MIHSDGSSTLQLFKYPAKRSDCLIPPTIFFHFGVFTQRYEIERVLTIAKTEHDKFIDILHELILFYNGLLLIHNYSFIINKISREFERVCQHL